MPSEPNANSDIIHSNVKNPPWGTEPVTPSTASTGKRKVFPWTTYGRDYQGVPGSAAIPQRMSTADHVPGGWPFERSHYKSIFRTPQVGYSRHQAAPALAHRKNNPHAQILDPWQYPDRSSVVEIPEIPKSAYRTLALIGGVSNCKLVLQTYLVWKNNPQPILPPASRETQSAPNLLQHNKHRWLNTTYNTVFNGRNLDLRGCKPKDAWNKERWRPDSKAQTPALNWQTEYSHDFRGARATPSSMERPHDMSWSNLSM